MTPLEKLEQFHAELNAALIAGVPLELGHPDGKAKPTVLSRLEQVVRGRLGGGQTLSGVAEQDQELPVRYRAALRVFDLTGDMGLVFSGLATRSIARAHLSRLLRSTLGYLVLLLTVACAGIYFFRDFIVPSFDLMHGDLELAPGRLLPTQGDGMQYLAIVITCLSIGLIVVWILVAFRASLPISFWMGGRRYQDDRLAATAVRTVSALAAVGVHGSEATQLSCQLVGNHRRLQKRLENTVEGLSDQADRSQCLESAANHFLASAADRLSVLKVVLPVTFLFVVGGTVTVCYALAIFWPVIVMLYELTLPTSN